MTFACVFFCVSLRAPALPPFSKMASMFGDAFAISIVSYGITISLGRMFALRFGYKVNSNQASDS